MEIIFVQIDVDIGSSTVANGVLGLVCGVITTLVVDMAFLVQVQVVIQGFIKGPFRPLYLSLLCQSDYLKLLLYQKLQPTGNQ